MKQSRVSVQYKITDSPPIFEDWIGDYLLQHRKVYPFVDLIELISFDSLALDHEPI